jgi:hypothetical protein
MNKCFFFLTFAAFLFTSACDDNEMSKEEYEAWLEKTHAELLTISESVTCTNSDEWDFMPIGRGVCGGPAHYLPYHESVNTILFQKKVAAYDKASETYRRKWFNGIICCQMYMPPPTGVKCEKGKAVLVYNNGCDDTAIIWPHGYETANDADLMIETISVDGYCLNVEYQSSGCDGSTWYLQLIDSGVVAESDPVQRYLKFNFVNNEACDALINKQRSFNLSALKQDGLAVILHIEGWDEAVLYE